VQCFAQLLRDPHCEERIGGEAVYYLAQGFAPMAASQQRSYMI
jgi:hypothetical protein